MDSTVAQRLSEILEEERIRNSALACGLTLNEMLEIFEALKGKKDVGSAPLLQFAFGLQEIQGKGTPEQIEEELFKLGFTDIEGVG